MSSGREKTVSLHRMSDMDEMRIETGAGNSISAERVMNRPVQVRDTPASISTANGPARRLPADLFHADGRQKLF